MVSTFAHEVIAPTSSTDTSRRRLSLGTCSGCHVPSCLRGSERKLSILAPTPRPPRTPIDVSQRTCRERRCCTAGSTTQGRIHQLTIFNICHLHTTVNRKSHQTYPGRQGQESHAVRASRAQPRSAARILQLQANSRRSDEPSTYVRHYRGTGLRSFNETRCDCVLMLLSAAHPTCNEAKLQPRQSANLAEYIPPSLAAPCLIHFYLHPGKWHLARLTIILPL